MTSKSRLKRFMPLIDAATQAQSLAYCPYSRYPVGAAVLTDTGRIFSGANVENASYGLSLCAERVAVFNAVSRGEKELRAVCIAGRKAQPCGACRQVMREFSSKDTTLILVDVHPYTGRHNIVSTKVYSMLPNAFDPLDAGLLSPKRRKARKPKHARRSGKTRRYPKHTRTKP